MNEFVILTDSSCDLPQGLADKCGLEVLPLTVSVDGSDYRNFLDEREISTHEFYTMQREGKIAKTAAANMEQISSAIKPLLNAGKDVLYLAFSSGLSSTYQTAALTAEELMEKHPGRKVYVVDTLCASMGEGLLVYLCAMEQQKGKSIEEVRDYAEQTKLHLCHWFTVDDLNHLKRGGRVSAATAMVGTMLNIKPVLHVDNEGHLIKVSTARGRKASIQELVNQMKKHAIDPAKQTVFISHGDCQEDAQRLAEEVRSVFGVTDLTVHLIGPVIGAHSGAGTLALFFLGDER